MNYFDFYCYLVLLENFPALELYFSLISHPEINILSAVTKYSTFQMDFLFGRRKTPAELLRQNQRALNKVNY